MADALAASKWRGAGTKADRPCASWLLPHIETGDALASDSKLASGELWERACKTSLNWPKDAALIRDQADRWPRYFA